jgi:hypothetical protein
MRVESSERVSSIQRENHPIEEPNHTNPIQLNQSNKLNQPKLNQVKQNQFNPNQQREEKNQPGEKQPIKRSQQREKPSNKRNQ